VNKTIHLVYLLFFVIFSSTTAVNAQEYAGHLNCNAALFNKKQPNLFAHKTTAADPLMLPFFDDFTGYSLFPDSSKWTDYHVYINNTMGSRPISRGVATFDALDWRGIPYDTFSNTNFRYADSLTSLPINLSLNVVNPADSVYLSFFYQPQGNGFFPLPQDSLMLFLKTRFGGFVKVWSVMGSSLKPFQQVMIPIADSLYFDSFFQFRFINIAALYWADAVWNIDYVRLGRNRTITDTAVNDIGFTSEPTFMLNDYTSMPYRQFFSYPAAERSSQYVCSLRNNYDFPQSVDYGYTGVALNTNTVLKPNTWNTAPLPGSVTDALVYPAYTTLVPLLSVGNYSRVTFQNKYFIRSISTADPVENDTIIKNQVFDNYLAYDDGSAEKSYYLNLYPTLPGKIAIEHHLNRPDTIRGMAIYFGRQVPFSFSKFFNINIYSQIEGVNGASEDNIIYTQEYCTPGYGDTVNQFWVYKFDKPVPMPAGIFFAGTFQPAESGADSLYFGLDVNRVGSNHAYFNVLSGWTPSLISGAIMMRPILGNSIIGTQIQEVSKPEKICQISPNPAKDFITIDLTSDNIVSYTICDMLGRKLMSGNAVRKIQIEIASLTPGMYLLSLTDNEYNNQTLKFIKE
jgi:hypothetical protein